ncbi:hypothetical protein U27_03965 [Candidatus Vecturithrix granuli]|uniref:Nif3-like dinuclear metal center hexameric protein n=1 Tax=Vecturithrix granuli TaxID=1499967 RepID=A0A081BXE6_VECG1|nr:hypothetical protein U27_03965 [Candidatus Vecturithrix granuli]
MLRTDLEHFLKELYHYERFEDYCQNGLQVEGKEEIRKIVFGVSFNLPFLQKAIEAQADAIIVHHGIFGKNFFTVKGVLKERVKPLLQYNISLFGIHLPMDAQEQHGNNAQLLSYLDAEVLEPYDLGFIGQNTQEHSLSRILDIFHEKLHPAGYQIPPVERSLASILTPKQQHGFVLFDHGPQIPRKIAIISGGAAGKYRSEDLLSKGVDTYISGSVDEATPAWSYETKTNFINLGHYWSEKSGPLALQQEIARLFDVKTEFIEVENVI